MKKKETYIGGDLLTATCQRLNSTINEMVTPLIEEDSTKLSFLNSVSLFGATIPYTCRPTYDRYEPMLKSNRWSIDDRHVSRQDSLVLSC